MCQFKIGKDTAKKNKKALYVPVKTKRQVTISLECLLELHAEVHQDNLQIVHLS